MSRVLNNRQGISDAVRKKILALAGEMKYTGTPGKRNVTLFANLDVDGFDIYTMHLLHSALQNSENIASGNRIDSVVLSSA